MSRRIAVLVAAAAMCGGCAHGSKHAKSASHDSTTEVPGALERGAGPGELVVALRYHARRGFRYIQSRWEIDGQPVGALARPRDDHDAEVFRGRLAPGTHEVSVVLTVAAPAHGGLMGRVGRRLSVDVRAGVGTCVVAEVIHSERDLAPGSGQATFVLWRTDCRPAR